MVVFPRPHFERQSGKGSLRLSTEHLQTLKSTDHALRLRRLRTPLDGVSALYIFVGILFCLCVAAPVLGYFRKRRRNGDKGDIRRRKRAAAAAVDANGQA